MLGSLVATLVHGLLDESSVHAWGWRLPFLAGFVVAAFGVWMRRGMIETPDFERQRDAGDTEKKPVMEAISSMPGKIIHVMALVTVMGGGFYMLFVWWPTYLTKIIDKPVPHALMVNTISMLVLMSLIPIMGLLSDLWGRRKVLVTALGAMVLLSYPLFVYSDHGTFAGALMCQILFAIMVSGVEGPMSATMVEMFPTRTRFSGIAVGYNISLALFGGTAPLVSTWLISLTGDVAAPAYYLIVLSLVSFTAAVRVHSRGGMQLT